MTGSDKAAQHTEATSSFVLHLQGEISLIMSDSRPELFRPTALQTRCNRFQNRYPYQIPSDVEHGAVYFVSQWPSGVSDTLLPLPAG